MSYNISTWKHIHIENLRIPLSVLTDEEECEVRLLPKGYIEVGGLAEDFFITGKLNGEWVDVHSLKSSGEGSGSSYEALKMILLKSTGILEAVLIWERGDSISKLSVINGVIEDKDYEFK